MLSLFIDENLDGNVAVLGTANVFLYVNWASQPLSQVSQIKLENFLSVFVWLNQKPFYLGLLVSQYYSFNWYNFSKQCFVFK